MNKEDIKITYEENICAECGAKYNQPLLVTPFMIVLPKYCEKCVDKFEKKEKAIEKKREEKRKQEWLERVGVKKNYFDVTLENYKPQNGSQEEALSKAYEVLNGKLKKLVLLGSNGVGKTHLAVALVKRMNGRIISAYEMFAIYRSCFSGAASEIDILHRFSNYPLLVIDEFGRTKGSEAEDNFLSVVIDNRHSSGLPTIILSNLIRKRDCVMFDATQSHCEKCTRRNCIESKLTPDVISRLRDKSSVIYMTGEDYRKIQNEKN